MNKTVLILSVLLAFGSLASADLVPISAEYQEPINSLIIVVVSEKETENVPSWPYINEYQYFNHSMEWSLFYPEIDLRIHPNGSGHLDNWTFKDVFHNPNTDLILSWRNEHYKKWYCRYYFDWRIEEMVCYDDTKHFSVIPEPSSISLLLLGIPLLRKRKIETN